MHPLLRTCYVMAASEIPSTVQDFICERIHAVEQLEILLLLHADRAETWTARSVAEEVRIEEPFAADALDHLRMYGLLVANAAAPRQYRYAPIDAHLGACVDTLAVLYARSRLEVLKLISRCAMDRIRTAQVRAFARAFLIRDAQRKERT